MDRVWIPFGLMLAVFPCEAYRSEKPALFPDGIRAVFDSLDSAWKPEKRYGASDNGQGLLAWGAAYLLDAYMDMFDATRDERYLLRCAALGSKVLKATDEAERRPDYRGKMLPGWGAAKYSLHGERIVWLVHTGMLTYPILRFALEAGRSGNPRLAAAAAEFASFSERALAVFDGEWVADSGGEGHYRFPDDAPASDNRPFAPMPVPFNQQLAAGRSLLLLGALTGNPAYLSKAEALARHFRSRLDKLQDGSFCWTYWYGKGRIGYPAREDVSHGAIDIGFAVLAGRRGLVFSKVDLEALAKTFLLHIAKEGGFAKKVDGSGEERGDLACLWLDLAEVEPAIWHRCRDALGNLGRPPEAYTFSAYAKLMKYAPPKMGETPSLNARGRISDTSSGTGKGP